MRPTRWPSFDSAIAMLTATVVLPTPPLPEPTAMIFETPGSATGEGMACEWAISSSPRASSFSVILEANPWAHTQSAASFNLTGAIHPLHLNGLGLHLAL